MYCVYNFNIGHTHIHRYYIYALHHQQQQHLLTLKVCCVQPWYDSHDERTRKPYVRWQTPDQRYSAVLCVSRVNRPLSLTRNGAPVQSGLLMIGINDY